MYPANNGVGEVSHRRGEKRRVPSSWEPGNSPPRHVRRLNRWGPSRSRPHPNTRGPDPGRSSPFPAPYAPIDPITNNGFPSTNIGPYPQGPQSDDCNPHRPPPPFAIANTIPYLPGPHFPSSHPVGHGHPSRPPYFEGEGLISQGPYPDGSAHPGDLDVVHGVYPSGPHHVDRHPQAGVTGFPTPFPTPQAPIFARLPVPAFNNWVAQPREDRNYGSRTPCLGRKRQRTLSQNASASPRYRRSNVPPVYRRRTRPAVQGWRGMRHSQGAGDESESEDDDTYDYISELNLMKYKNGAITKIDYKFPQKPIQTRNGSRWPCTITVILQSDTSEDHEIKKASRGKASRKLVKQKVTKLALEEIKSLPFLKAAQDSPCNKSAQPAQSAEQENGSQSCADAVTAIQEKGNGAFNVIGALTQLWHKNVLAHNPDYVFVPSEGPNGWKCTVVLKIIGADSKNFQDCARTQRAAKRKVACKAFQYLKELKIEGMDEFHMELEQEDPGVKGESVQRIEQNTEAMEMTAQISDDEEGAHVHEEDKVVRFKRHLVLPKGYELVIATRPQQCDAWFKANANTDSNLGIYIDSHRARTASQRCESLSEPKPAVEKEDLKLPLLCFSTHDCGLIIRADKCVPDCETNEPYLLDGFWIPESAKRILNSSSIPKYGCGIADGLLKLARYDGICPKAVRDISVRSYAMTGCLSQTKRIQWQLGELTRRWIGMDFVSARPMDIWSGVEDAPHDFVESCKEEGDVMGTGILSAYACVCVKDRLDLAKKKMQVARFGVNGRFYELSRRLLRRLSMS